ncbi:MAG: SAM-dependent methyltransferase [Zymomonas mobilis subsp. pomaceae]|uniref:TsaA-like domain-containing protein n=1 Tax=Zymomonas mobilis subsp. pomaceae (strain ATCC 29192 / DSM 22645 / JCM 10191 / CCUG 17912 / NBRC 13757 / NCIMB 11200 / NRRL B-4491 / Barker I) TaxID=579138 RepID=F8EVP1_ZYMMT|nr:SAM-dependent methyltransferase [Zymomonas mobilis]AEI38378.1 protein of unknown function UPF0066 [Zymomonas mobilis subsp. pomaceae ATCC 29192]MDX5948068.1 SAM-dependent methyltransferase [Zymomonas mobilis subsp. pomaceae]
MATKNITVTPIGHVRSLRKDITDDNWGGVISTIVIDSEVLPCEALLGLDQFSHIEVIFYFDRVPLQKIQYGTRRPRGRSDWPEVGILAQRGKGRPNLMGVSRCQLLSVEAFSLKVRGLDAIDGTPIIDIKPYMAEFGPIGTVIQPEWSHEVMKDYYLTIPE